jgi:hypothetical protein
MEYSGAGGKLIHEKNHKQKISWHCPFKTPANTNFSASKQNDLAEHIDGAISVSNYTIFQDCKFLY